MTNHAVSNRADLRERTKTMSRHGDRRGQIADFRDSFETINWLYLLFKCGIKTKTHFEWLLWHWSSLGQLNLKPTRPNGLVGCKVPTDLVKISVKEATHMGFNYTIQYIVHNSQFPGVFLQLHIPNKKITEQKNTKRLKDCTIMYILPKMMLRGCEIFKQKYLFQWHQNLPQGLFQIMVLQIIVF